MNVVKVLIAHNAPVDVKANDGMTPLDYVINYGNFKLLTNIFFVFLKKYGTIHIPFIWFSR